MTAPTITGATGAQPYTAVVDLSTTSTENVLSNTAASGKTIRVDVLAVMNADGSSAATIDLLLYDQDGTGMNDDTGTYQAAIGADAVAGSLIGEIGPKTLSVAAGGGQVVFDRQSPFFLFEDQSIVAQASAADDLVLIITYVVIG